MILASDKEMVCGGIYLHEMISMDLVLCIRYVMQLVLVQALTNLSIFPSHFPPFSSLKNYRYMGPLKHKIIITWLGAFNLVRMANLSIINR